MVQGGGGGIQQLMIHCSFLGGGRGKQQQQQQEALVHYIYMYCFRLGGIYYGLYTVIGEMDNPKRHHVPVQNMDEADQLRRYSVRPKPFVDLTSELACIHASPTCV